MADLTQEEASALSAKALRLGQETAFSAKEAARGMETLVALGKRIDQAITKAMKADEHKIGAAIKAAIEHAERGVVERMR